MAAGNGKSTSEGRSKDTEYYDTETESWIKITEYPAFEIIFGFASLYSNGYFYIIGGWRYEASNLKQATENIFKLDSQTWQ